jgi:O-methyltransferase
MDEQTRSSASVGNDNSNYQPIQALRRRGQLAADPSISSDGYRDAKCEFADFDTVASYCRPHNIELVRGDITDTCRQLKDVDLALSFFDTDNYTAARRALSVCMNRTVVGGYIVFDHWYSPDWPRTIGERIAAQEAVSSPQWWNLHGTGVFLRLPD